MLPGRLARQQHPLGHELADGIAPSAAKRCDSGSAASSGSSLSVSTRTPWRRAAAGVSITTAAASSCAPTRRSESGVTSSSSRTLDSGQPQPDDLGDARQPPLR